MKITCISDTHGQHDKIKINSCDILIHAGDMSVHGQRARIREFAEWHARQPATYKILIAGNHDIDLSYYTEWADELFKKLGIIYLKNKLVEVEGLRIYGSPYTPRFGNWAFMFDRGSAYLKATWDQIPDNLDILITHGPPYGFLDMTYFEHILGQKVGCELLRNKVLEIKPKIHVFGHIHESKGVLETEHTTFINAAQCGISGRIENFPIEFEIK